MGDDRAAIDRAFAILNEHGIYVNAPWESDLDDLERERYEAFAAALRSYGAECVDEFRMRVKYGDHPALVARARSLKSKSKEPQG